MEGSDMAALVRHDTITSLRAIGCLGANEPARTKLYSAADAAEVARPDDAVGRMAEPDAAENRFPAPAYVHHVPGRLRLKAAEFRQNPSLLEAARRELIALRGVSSVSTNPLIGSILVEYDPLVSAPAALSEAMQKRGFPCIWLEAPRVDTAGQTPLTESLAGMAVRTLFELLVERFLVAVVAAVI
jgi:hypothetical protein